MDIRTLYWLGRGVATVQSETYFSWCGWFASKIFSKHFEKSSLSEQWRHSLSLSPSLSLHFTLTSRTSPSFSFILPHRTIPSRTMKRSGLSLNLAAPDESVAWFIRVLRSPLANYLRNPTPDTIALLLDAFRNRVFDSDEFCRYYTSVLNELRGGGLDGRKLNWILSRIECLDMLVKCWI